MWCRDTARKAAASNATVLLLEKRHGQRSSRTACTAGAEKNQPLWRSLRRLSKELWKANSSPRERRIPGADQLKKASSAGNGGKFSRRDGDMSAELQTKLLRFLQSGI